EAQRLRAQRLALVDVAGYVPAPARQGSGALYAGLWVGGGKGEERRLSVGVPAAGLREAVESLKGQGFFPLPLQAFVRPGEVPIYSSVWEKVTTAWNSSWKSDEEDYRAGHLDKVAQDVSLIGRSDQVRQVGSACWFAGVWHWQPARQDVRLAGLDPVEHL